MNAIPFPVETELPLYDARRPVLRTRPLKAWHHFRELLKDKERTEEVFRIFEALPWRHYRAAGIAFLESERGQYLRAREACLPAILDDHAALRRTPAGSLAHAYCDFMEREGLSAQGLVDEFERFAQGKPRFHDQFEWYMNRSRDVHDLLHVLTGYGRDSLGEACVLAFTYSQQPSPAHLFIGYMAGLNMKKTVKSKAPVLRAVREGQRLGKACPRLIEQSITELLPLPIDEVRRRLHITPAREYQRAHQVWRGMGVDPYHLLVRTPAAAQQDLAQAA
jgi:ubiquinone biosynthesis protein COQ4